MTNLEGIRPKFCETLKPGYYLFENESIGMRRCVYASGTTKGNKWIELNVPDASWTGLLWNCISKDQIDDSVYFEGNPTEYNF